MLSPLLVVRAAPFLPAFLRRQESTRPAISRAPSTFTTSRPSRVAVGHQQRPQTSVARLDSCLRPLPSFLRQESVRHSCCALPSFAAQAGIHSDLNISRAPSTLTTSRPSRRSGHARPQESSIHVGVHSVAVVLSVPSFLLPLPSFLRRQESTRPAISRAPSTFTTSRPSRVTTPSDINSALEHLSLAWIPACAGMTEVRERASGATTGQRCSGR